MLLTSRVVALAALLSVLLALSAREAGAQLAGANRVSGAASPDRAAAAGRWAGRTFGGQTFVPAATWYVG